MKLLLDIGAGNKPYTKEGYKTIAMDKHDFSSDYKGMENVEFMQHDLIGTPAGACLPFPDNHFDFIWCHHFLEHLPHQIGESGRDALVAVMDEIGRILKKDCEAHIIVPWIEHTNAWRHPAHYRFFNKDLFAWFSHTNTTPDHEAYGYVHKMKYEKCWVQDEMHIYSIFRGL